MATQKYSHLKITQWTKIFLAIAAFVFPLELIWNSFTSVKPIHGLTEIVITITLSLFMMVPILVGAYFYQDIWVDEDGILVEFLWKKVRVKWEDIIEIKLAWGFWLAPKESRPVIVLVNRLTPFHCVFGVLYGWSIRPGFIIFPTISDFQSLKKTIESRAKR
jgi:hypothetical protein